jgi:hypothetical protein
LESTDREDIGADLRAPVTDEAGRDNWHYTLFREAKIGDVVFHYDKSRSAIVSMSRIAGPPIDAPIIWAARGSYARERGAQPEEVRGYMTPLSDNVQLPEPLSLEMLRLARPMVQAIYDQLGESALPRYFPFELSARPVRPLQGYAFKLPSTFVEAFPALSSATFPIPLPAELSETELFHNAIAAIENVSATYDIAGLQRLRAKHRGLQRVASTIFGSRVRADDWAFHLGGRDELQFNVGLDFMPDGARAFRSGVAFSFEPSRSLPNIEIFVPKVGRFNSWMREHSEAFADLAMWHWQDGVRSKDYAPRPIPEELIRDQSFVFLGHRQRLPSIEPHAALATFDRLLPLYEWVERPNVSPESLLAADTSNLVEALRLNGGREAAGGRWIAASIRERTLDIFLRHAEIQHRLKSILTAEGFWGVVAEAPIGLRAIDLLAFYGEELWFYEIKTAATVRGCLREAIGQLLEYSLWPGATRPHRLVVVGEPPIEPAALEYLTELNKSFPIPITYRQLSLDA